MPQRSSHFVCSGCGHAARAWTGRCPGCGEWNTLVETVQRESRGHRQGGSRAAQEAAPRPTPLRDVQAPAVDRLRTGVAELDRVLGGGLVPGSLVLLG